MVYQYTMYMWCAYAHRRWSVVVERGAFETVLTSEGGGVNVPWWWCEWTLQSLSGGGGGQGGHPNAALQPAVERGEGGGGGGGKGECLFASTLRVSFYIITFMFLSLRSITTPPFKEKPSCAAPLCVLYFSITNKRGWHETRQRTLERRPGKW